MPSLTSAIAATSGLRRSISALLILERIANSRSECHVIFLAAGGGIGQVEINQTGVERETFAQAGGQAGCSVKPILARVGEIWIEIQIVIEANALGNLDAEFFADEDRGGLIVGAGEEFFVDESGAGENAELDAGMINERAAVASAKSFAEIEALRADVIESADDENEIGGREEIVFADAGIQS